LVTLSGLVSAVIDRPVAKAARAVRKALERIGPEPSVAQAPAAPRKSKGWRRHVRKAKARQSAA